MIIHNRNFNVKQIADSGQCFRMNPMEENKYSLVAYGRYLEVVQKDENTIELGCREEEYEQIWHSYFDMDYDYGSVVDSLIHGRDLFLKEAAEYGRGIRILRQEPFEMLISYIISQNKNIPAIKSCIEAICKRFGEPKESPDNNGAVYYTFPEPGALAAADPQELRELKTGYRDEYIIQAAQAVAGGTVDLERLAEVSYQEAFQTLMGMKGIGEKVANCICLYGLHKIDGFPVDVWIKKVLKEIYQNNFPLEKYAGYAGIIQQYMFYYMRNGRSNTTK